MSDRYLIIEEHKYEYSKNDWSIKFADQSYDDAITKLVALETLNEHPDKIYYMVCCKHLWSKKRDEVEMTNGINSAQENKQERKYPFLD